MTAVTVEAPAVTATAPRPRRRRRTNLAPYAMLAPGAVFILALVGWPIVQALLLAFRDSLGHPSLINFQNMVNEAQFGSALRNTLLLVAFILPIETALALAMAVILNSRPRGWKFVQYIWTLPLAISDLASGLVWLSIFTSHGFFNSALVDVHRPAIGWLDYNNLPGIFFAIVIAEVWRSSSLVMVVVLSGIQSIPADLGEAASALGANAWQRFWHVTLPLLRPSLQVALILRTTLAIQIFGVVVTLAGSALPVLAGQSFQDYTMYQEAPLASAYAVVILAMSSLGTFIYLRTLRSRREVFSR